MYPYIYGHTKKKLEIARAMKKKGYKISDIEEIIGLTKEEAEKL